MMRPSFLLLLMVAGACCSPNSSKETQGCADLGEITQAEADLMGYAHSSPTINKGRVTCSSPTPILKYINNDGKMVSANKMICTGNKWTAYLPLRRMDTFKTTKVSCIGSFVTKTTPQPEGPKGCAPFGEITQAELDAAIPGYVNPRSSAEVIDGRVICSDPTPEIVYINNEGEMQFTHDGDEMMCATGMWYISGHEFLLALHNTTKVCCKGPSYKETTTQPEKPKGCAPFGEITQAELDAAIPGYVNPRSSAEVIDGRVICSDPTPEIVYINNEGEMQFTHDGDEMMCATGMWYISGHEFLLALHNTTKVCCKGPSYKETTTQPEKPKGCAPFGEITQAELDAAIPGYVNPRSSAEVIDGRVFCSDATPEIVYINNDGEVNFTHEGDVMMCALGMWYVSGHEFLLALHNTTKVCCKGTSVATQ